jgi:hypothetical protein
MHFGTVRIRVGSWLLCAAACTSVTFAAGCLPGDEPEPGEVDEAEVDFRLDGCGAELKKGTASQTCKYTSKAIALNHDSNYPNHNFQVKASCDGDSKLKCEFSYTGCYWSVASTTTCLKNAPKCPAGPVIDPIKLTHSYALTQGDTLCDPKGTEEALAAQCFKYASETKIDTKTAVDKLKQQCFDMTTPNVTSEVSCCVKNESGDSGGGCDGGTTGAGETMTWDTGASWGSGSSSSWSGGDDAGSTSITGDPGDTTLVVEPVGVVKLAP